MKKRTIALYLCLVLFAAFVFVPNVLANTTHYPNGGGGGTPPPAASATFTCEVFGDDFIIDRQLADIVATVITVIQVAVPVILIIFGMIDFAKAVMAQKEDDIKNGQKVFIKRLIAAALVFFVIIFVRLIVGWVAGEEGIMHCVDCFINRGTVC